MNVIYTGWAEMQEPNGMIQEVLGSMGGGGRITGPMDESAGGRVMSDTTCIFILDALRTPGHNQIKPFKLTTEPLVR
jgi:hypothetical protein